MKFRISFAFATLFLLLSCSQIVENIIDEKIRDSYISPYAGTYVGTYSGQDSGTVTLEVSKKDAVTVKRHSGRFNTDETLYGILNGPTLTQVASQQSGFKMTGNLSSSNGIFTGTWIQSGISGTWELKKK